MPFGSTFHAKLAIPLVVPGGGAIDVRIFGFAAIWKVFMGGLEVTVATALVWFASIPTI